MSDNREEELQKVKDQLKAEGYDVEEYDLEDVGDQGEHEDHGGGEEDGVSGSESGETEVTD